MVKNLKKSYNNYEIYFENLANKINKIKELNELNEYSNLDANSLLQSITEAMCKSWGKI